MADLCTIEDVKAWLGIAPAQTGSDALLTRLIAATSKDALRFMDRADLTPNQNYTEVYSAEDAAPVNRMVARALSRLAQNYRLELRHWPINSVASVTIDGQVFPASADAIAQGWFLENEDSEDNASVLLVGASLTGTQSGCGIPSTIVVTYNAGYATVPADLAQAAIEWVSYRFRSRDFIGQQSKHLAQGETAGFIHVDCPVAVKAVLERYAERASLL